NVEVGGETKRRVIHVGKNPPSDVTLFFLQGHVNLAVTSGRADRREDISVPIQLPEALVVVSSCCDDWIDCTPLEEGGLGSERERSEQTHGHREYEDEEAGQDRHGVVDDRCRPTRLPR